MSVEKSCLYSISKDAKSGNIEILPMDGNAIIIRGEQEVLFFIQGLIECLQWQPNNVDCPDFEHAKRADKRSGR